MDLSGTWRAVAADDQLRRSAVGMHFDDSAWAKIQVPGHWRSNPSLADSDGPLLYRTNFTVEQPDADQRSWIVLDGVFYQADVWLDGAYIGDPEGYFFPHSFDVSSLIRLGDEHVLAVEVACAAQTSHKGRRNITGVLQQWDAADPHWNPGGLWRPVRVETTGPVRLDRLRVLCRDVNEARAHLRLHGRLDSDAPRSVRIRTTVDGVVTAEIEQSLARGINEVDWNLDVDNPRLWWPLSLGAQELTDVQIDVVVDGSIGAAPRPMLRPERSRTDGTSRARRRDRRRTSTPASSPWPADRVSCLHDPHDNPALAAADGASAQPTGADRKDPR